MLTNKELANRLSASEAECARLNKWADGMTDAAMKERATAEAYQRELKAECAKLRENVALKAAQNPYPPNYLSQLTSLACNCAANKPGQLTAGWICPIHGQRF